MFTILDYYEMPSIKDSFETIEEARERVINDLKSAPTHTGKKYIIEVLEVLVNDVPIPPVKSVNIKTILDFKVKSKAIEDLSES